MPERLLVIDDETNVRTMIRLALEFSGYEVAVAADGPEGLQKFTTEGPFDLVILDHRMPGMTGEEVHDRLIKLESNVRVLMITAFGTIDLALESMRKGAVGFLRKPFTADTLRSTVQSAITKEVQASSSVPVNQLVGAFTRTTINGFSSNMINTHRDLKTSDWITTFETASPNGDTRHVTVKVPPYVTELILAYSDCESLPGNERFWSAVAEEALANYLWQNAELPSNNLLIVDDLSSGLRHWIDEVLTVGQVDC